MNVSACLIPLLGVATLTASIQAAGGEARKPNIILCMADDLGWGDLGYNGHPHIKTPHLDGMAKAGARLDRFYVGSPLCVPSRAGFLTGRTAVRCGISNHRDTVVSHLRDEEITIAEICKAQGYRTGHFGKWHLGMLTEDYRGDKKVLMTPGMQGFDEWFASPSSVSTFDPYLDPGAIGRATGGRAVDKPTPIDLRAGYIHNGKPLKEPIEGCAAEIVMDRALPFIREASGQQKPFLAIIWFNPPHSPVVGHPKYMEEHYAHLPEPQQHYYSLVTAIDAQMGRLRGELENLGIAGNTLLTFTSDNGPGPPIGRDRKPDTRLQGSAGPFRERKASIYEGGIREPGLAIWPGVIPPGKVIEMPCTTLDYFPTIAKLIGAELPDRPYDGVDIMPLLTGRKTESDRSIGFLFRDAVALSGPTHKLIAGEQTKGKRRGGAVDFKSLKFELYDLAADPGETTDFAEKQPKRVAAMKKELKQWVASVDQSRLGADYPVAGNQAGRTHLFLLSGQSNMARLDPDVSFTPALKKAFPNDEIIVTKVAYGGRPIARWVPRQSIYNQLIKEAREMTKGKKIDTVTFVWMQGERDHQDDATTQAYEANLTALYQQLTEDLGREDINWVIGRLSDARLGTPNWDTIRSVQVKVAEENHRASWIDTDDLNGPDNGVHCPPEGYRKMGLRFAERAIALIKGGSSDEKSDFTGIPEGLNIRIIPLAQPLGSEDGFARWMYPGKYTAQDILEMIEELKPAVLERFITGRQQRKALVPVREGAAPMSVVEFLDAAQDAGAPGCIIIPKLNLTWISWGREKYFWDTAENNYRLPLKRPIRTVNLDNWKAFLETHGEQRARELLKRLRDIGYERIGVNMAGGYRAGFGQISFADFLIDDTNWKIRLSTLEKLKGDPDIRQYYLYIDYPGQMKSFMELGPDRQADVLTKVIQPAEKREGFTFVYPILFDDWDCTEQITSSEGPWRGASLYEVIRDSALSASGLGQSE